MDSDGLALRMTDYRLDGPDDIALALRQAKAGSAAAFERILLRYERQVVGAALRLLGNREDARDAAQEVFLRLHRRLDRLAEDRDPAGWLYRVTVNVCRDMERKRPKAVAIADVAEPRDLLPDPQQSASRREQQEVIRHAMRALSQKERAVVVLRDMEGLSTREVAGILGSSEATVRSQLCSARLKLREFTGRLLRRRP